MPPPLPPRKIFYPYFLWRQKVPKSAFGAATRQNIYVYITPGVFAAKNTLPPGAPARSCAQWHAGRFFLLQPAMEIACHLHAPLARLGQAAPLKKTQSLVSWQLTAETNAGATGRLPTGSIVDSCRWIPLVEQAKKIANEVIRELGA